MRGAGSIIELVLGVGLALVMAALLFQQLDQIIPTEPRGASCSIVKEQIICPGMRANK